MGSPEETEAQDSDFIQRYFSKYDSSGRKPMLHQINNGKQCDCQPLCTEMVSESFRYMLCKATRNLSIAGFNNFLMDHEKLTTEVAKTVKDNKSRARCTYFLPTQTGSVRVCEATFMNTLYGIHGNMLKEISTDVYNHPGVTKKRDKEIYPLPGKQKYQPTTPVHNNKRLKISPSPSKQISTPTKSVGNDEGEYRSIYKEANRQPVASQKSVEESSPSPIELNEHVLVDDAEYRMFEETSEDADSHLEKTRKRIKKSYALPNKQTSQPTKPALNKRGNYKTIFERTPKIPNGPTEASQGCVEDSCQSPIEPALDDEGEYLIEMLETADENGEAVLDVKPTLEELEVLLGSNSTSGDNNCVELDIVEQSDMVMEDEPAHNEPHLLVEALPNKLTMIQRRNLKERGLSYTRYTGEVCYVRVTGIK